MRTPTQTAIAETVRHALPIGYHLKGTNLQAAYRLRITNNYIIIATIFLYPDSTIRCNITKGIHVNRKTNYPKRHLNINLNHPNSIEQLEQWVQKLQNTIQ